MKAADLLAEKAKLRANWLNIVAGGCMVTGVVGPLIGVVFGQIGLPDKGIALLLVCLGSIFVSAVVHQLAQNALSEIEVEP